MDRITLETLYLPVAEDEAYFDQIPVSVLRNIDGNYRWNRVVRTTQEFIVINRGEDEAEYVEPTDILRVRFNIPGDDMYYVEPGDLALDHSEFADAAREDVFNWA